MPKLKTHTGAKKRFKLTKNGKVKRAHAYKSHLLNGHGKTAKSKRRLRRGAYSQTRPTWRRSNCSFLTNNRNKTEVNRYGSC